MPDLLIRNAAPEDLARLDASATRLGLSRNEYIRRRLRQEAYGAAVVVADLQQFSMTFSDLDDDNVMSEAWPTCDTDSAIRRASMPVEYASPAVEDRAVAVQGSWPIAVTTELRRYRTYSSPRRRSWLPCSSSTSTRTSI